jgi:phosphoenolpyruvate carboxylase
MRGTRLHVGMPAGEGPHAPLRAGVRRLGRILGDAVREQEGQDVFGAVETVGRHRRGETDLGTGLQITLNGVAEGFCHAG